MTRSQQVSAFSKTARMLTVSRFTDMKYSLLLIEPEQLPYTFFFQNKSEKIEWMSALTHMLTKRYICEKF